MKAYSKYLIILPLAAVVILGLSFTKSGSREKPSPNTKVVKEFKASLTVRINEEKKSYDLSPFIGSTLLEAMDKAGIKIEKKGDGDNSFITAIEGKSADAKRREFWEFLVNGKQAEVGAGSYKIQNNDQIEWQLSLY